MTTETRLVRPTRRALPAAVVYGLAALVVSSVGALATSAGQGPGGWYSDAEKPRAWRVDRVAAGLLVPYLAWILFATLLNASIAAMN